MSTRSDWNVFLLITKSKRYAGWIKLSCQVTGKSGLKEFEEMGKPKKSPDSFVAIRRPRKTKHTVHFIQGERHVVVYIRTTRCVNLNTGLSCRLQQRTHALAAPNKVCRTTRQHIPALDTSGPKASASKPRHLCQSHHHAGTTQSQVSQWGIYLNSSVNIWVWQQLMPAFPPSCCLFDTELVLAPSYSWEMK